MRQLKLLVGGVVAASLLVLAKVEYDAENLFVFVVGAASGAWSCWQGLSDLVEADKNAP